MRFEHMVLSCIFVCPSQLSWKLNISKDANKQGVLIFAESAMYYIHVFSQIDSTAGVRTNMFVIVVKK